MSWYLVPSLVKLRNEVNHLWPNRDKSSDGAVGDTSHAARKSSHNPDYAHGGAVRAVDIDNNGKSYAKTDIQKAVVKAAVGDKRVWYVISNGIIYSRTYGWAARRYTGSNPHDKHVHVSVREIPSQWKDTSKWLGAGSGGTGGGYKIRPEKVDVPYVRNQFRRAAGKVKGKPSPTNGVARIQKALNEEIGTKLAVDGVVGTKTLNAWEKWERKNKVKGADRIPTFATLRPLGKGRFYLLPQGRKKK